MPSWDEAAVGAAARRLRLVADPRRRRQGEGARLGVGPGASLEFHDHRPYAPGDDLRHLDWSAYARSGQLMLRRQRKEVSPRVEVLLDCSASMGLSPAKAALAANLAALCASLAERDGGRPRLWALGQTTTNLCPEWRRRLQTTPCAGASGLMAAPVPALAAGAERIVISDGLCPEGATAAVRRLGGEAGSLAVVQVLGRAELDPGLHGAIRLVDVEGGEADVVADAKLCDGYRERLARLQDSWRQSLHGRGCGLLTVVVEDGFDSAIRVLVRSGLLVTAVGQR
jgi:uncharacterized protein (DUF58 family)